MSYAKPAPKPVIGFSLALDILILDQLSKWLILEYVLREQVQPNGLRYGLWEWITKAPARIPSGTSVEVMPFFNLTMVWNEGISFGLFHGSEIWLLTGLALAISAGFSVWMMRADSWWQIAGLGMAIGGAIGNVIDRLRFGGVADFFDFYIGKAHYPAFNVADCGVVVGIALLVVDGIFFEPKRNKRAEAA